MPEQPNPSSHLTYPGITLKILNAAGWSGQAFGPPTRESFLGRSAGFHVDSRTHLVRVPTKIRVTDPTTLRAAKILVVPPVTIHDPALLRVATLRVTS